MKELDLLKKNWDKIDNFEQLSELEIHNMLLKKSSSIVKWIVVISILELALWSGTSLLFNTDSMFTKLKINRLESYLFVINAIHYTVIVGFILAFYFNYKKISVVTSTKNLMNAIVKTRKTVQNYIWYNLGMIGLSLIFGVVLAFNFDPSISKLNQNDNFKYGFIIGFTIIAALVIGLFWLLYRLIYGRLLKKLYQNYEELKRIDL